MTKIDFKKSMRNLYAPSAREFVIVDVPPMHFLMIDGIGDPGTAKAYRDALEALYAVSYKLKFMSRNDLDRDYVVPPLQALWWAADMDTFVTRDKKLWKWTAMIMQPDWISHEMYSQAKAVVESKSNPAALSKMRFEVFDEGLAVQIMHIGSYDDEGPTIQRLHREFLPANGLLENGRHHEIYLGDPRKTAPEKLRTILRQPVRKVSG